MSSRIFFCILGGVVLVSIVGGFFIYKTRTVPVDIQKENPILTTNAALPLSGEGVTADLHNDFKFAIPSASQVDLIVSGDKPASTANWRMLESSNSGYQIKVPKESTASLGCFGHGCEPKIDGDWFYYSITGPNPRNNAEEGPNTGMIGMEIHVAQKRAGTSLDNWIKDYVPGGASYIMQPKRGLLGGHDTLMFDASKSLSNSVAALPSLKYSIYPNDTYGNGADAPNIPDGIIRYYIVDAGDRYIIIIHSVKIEPSAFDAYYTIDSHTADATSGTYSFAGQTFYYDTAKSKAAQKTYADEKLIKIYNNILSTLAITQPGK